MTTKKALARLLAGTAITTFALVGCASGNDTSAPGAASGGSASSAAAQGQFNDADVAFAQGMIPHHRQAVAMAELAAGRTETPQVLDLAARIGGAQEPEITTMTAWLQEWGAEVPAENGMGGMDGMDHSGMGGMMTPEQMSALQQASGAEFDRMFLEMMVEHHRGAVEMAQTEIEEGSDPEALALAQEIVDAQQAEISEMESLLQGA
ncbi:DUF305 domain-containing protein [Pseudonocardia sp. KRD-184]|uniref:DUF305 domain-containing protein n=1 Tax=Pseudonocardia oceani TaxID=2792013 RepID=A0ABS6U313_9PSEU|nr:DUF305 domain-containing protein [Pseudonocardia oceani]MBW0088712.1 DUF305 domain-containing protein [Pseudonocardia oceani]MBW0095651.1 DUF305 domain-containing protein [Pseudonocardia oceani]MBW0121836.1 DUF305 domain-containing protein [Pseudonocardia oceani]MBW0126608.1 DUF305 domain-containing protein [Pseudonocardia oceani]